MNLNDLKKPMLYKWKIQTVSKTKPVAQCVAYIDARDVMDRLDEVCGADNWQDSYSQVGDKFVAGIGIKSESGWIWKYDTGTAGDIEGEKSIFSDAFKRAGVKWGVGRFLYDLDMKWVKTDKPGQGAVPVDDNGNRIWDLTKHINEKDTQSIAKPTAHPDNEFNQSKCKDCGGPIAISQQGKPYCKNKCWLKKDQVKEVVREDEVIVPDMPF